MMNIETPTVLRFDASYADREKLLRAHLEYIDKKVEYDIKRLKGSAHWYAGDENKMAEYEAKLEEMKAKRKRCLLFDDGDGGMWTYSGLAPQLALTFGDKYTVDYQLPEPELIGYVNMPKYKARDYQEEACQALLDAASKGPRRVEIGTGLGKSTIIRMILKKLGLKTVVMAPSTSIARQLYDDFCYHFGKARVGLYGDGKKESTRLITVGIDDSLTRVEDGSEHWRNLSKAQVFIADESHLCPAETLASVCLGLCANAPYRFFFSATQVRTDGLDLVLDGITGETVYEKTVREGVDQGYLARPYFRMVRMVSDEICNSSDPNKMTRAHLYYNPKVNKHAGNLANLFVSKMQRPTIILVEEVEQFAHLLPYLKHEVQFAHGPLTKSNAKQVPQAFRESNPIELVNQFNAGKIPILVGTKCIATGTDLQIPEAAIYLMGKQAEVKIKQAVGRETRGGKESDVFNPWTGKQKLDCIHVDYDILNVSILHRHAWLRSTFYDQLYGPVEKLDA